MKRRGCAQDQLLLNHPDERNRLMGIDSVVPTSEEDRFGDGEASVSEIPNHGVADNSETPVDSHSGIGFCPGVVDSSRGGGTASLAEILHGMPRFDVPAACASQDAAEFLGVQPNPRQVMSPNSSLTLPQDPFGLQAPKWRLALMPGKPGKSRV